MAPPAPWRFQSGLFAAQHPSINQRRYGGDVTNLKGVSVNTNFSCGIWQSTTGFLGIPPFLHNSSDFWATWYPTSPRSDVFCCGPGCCVDTKSCRVGSGIWTPSVSCRFSPRPSRSFGIRFWEWFLDANWEVFHVHIVHPQPYGGGSNCEVSSGKIT
jgi:hypothetical protein